MAAWRRAIELSLRDEDTEKLRSIAQSRTEPASRVERARILLAYREDPSFFAVGRALGLHHQTVQRCVERAVVEGATAALDDARVPVGNRQSRAKPRPGWCRWPVRRRRTLAIPTNCGRQGFSPATLASTDLLKDMRACQSGAGQVCKILDQEEVRPHKVRYYLDPARSRICRKNGRSAVCLSPSENPQGGGCRGEKGAKRGGGALARVS